MKQSSKDKLIDDLVTQQRKKDAPFVFADEFAEENEELERSLERWEAKQEKGTSSSFLEKTLEDIIFEAYNKEGGQDILISRGLRMSGHLLRQVNLGQPGILDLVTLTLQGRTFSESDNQFLPHLKITIYELKKKEVNISTIIQICRYQEGIKQILAESGLMDKFNIEFQLVTIGQTIQMTSDFHSLASSINNLRTYCYTYDFDGINFEEKSFLAFDKVFCIPSNASTFDFYRDILKKSPMGVLRINHGDVYEKASGMTFVENINNPEYSDYLVKTLRLLARDKR